MNRGPDPVKAVGNDVTLFYATFVGGGDAANLTVPDNATVPKITNLATSGTRTGEGVYDCVLADTTPQIIAVSPVVYPSSAGHTAESTTTFNPVTRTVTITTRNAAGTADDLPTGSRLVLVVHGRNSTG